MKEYRIFDIRGGLMGDDKVVEAKSPIEAVRKFYDNVKRDKFCSGPIVVNNSYVYYGDRKKGAGK